MNENKRRVDRRWSFSPTAIDQKNRAEIEADLKAMDIELSPTEFVAQMTRSGMMRYLEKLKRKRHDRR